MVTTRHAPLGAMIALLLAQAATAAAPGQVKDETIYLPQLQGPARIVRDVDGMPHIYAHNQRDALFLQGWVQAQDRLFQMDVLRRQASGTLAELVGASQLASDAELQTIGLARAAQRSLNALSPATKAGLEAYAAGVNAWVERNPLPVQYGALQLTKASFKPWTALDSAIIGKALAFNLSFDLDDGATTDYTTYVATITAQFGPQIGAENAEKLAQALFFLDVFRSAPFDKAASVPDATGKPPFLGPLKTGPAAASGKSSADVAATGAPALGANDTKALRELRQRFEAVPFLKKTLNRSALQIGSNEWAVAGSLTKDGRPLVANDPHLGLDLPATFYQLQIVGQTDGFDAIGSSVTGTPWVVLGQNRFVTWGETTTGFDVTDMYVDQLAPKPGGGFVSVHQDGTGEVTAIPLTFKVNALDGLANGADTIVTLKPGEYGLPTEALTLARRNNGPVVASLGGGKVVTVQYTGFSATRELDTFRLLNLARNVDDFKTALQYFDVGSQNFIYGDIQGNIGYFTTGEVPLREDLQQGKVNGAPPWFVRNGYGGNEWLKDPNPDQFNGTGYLSLPFEELPQTVNPRNGWVVNANNDTSGATLDNNSLNQLRPGGQGIYFLGYTFDFGTRAGRITQALKERLAQGPVDRSDMKAIQADVKLLDAEVFTPYITGAFDRAKAAGAPLQLAALAADPRVAEAVGRLAAWNFTTPTGVASGYDAADVDGQLAQPSAQEVAHSIAATIYSVWRGQAIKNGVDRTLQGLGLGGDALPGSGESIKALRHLVERNGIGESTIDFFAWTGLATPAQRRDAVMLLSLKDALDLLAGPKFAAAFGNSPNQDDYRWGKLHRITFDGLVVGGPFSIPNTQLGFPPSFETLPGLATDGGFGVVDASSHNPRADAVDLDKNTPDGDEFTFGSGPNRRYVGSPGTVPGSIDAETSLPGGMSGVLSSPFYANLLGRWLTNDTYPLRTGQGEVMQAIHSQQQFKPANAGKSSTAPNNNNNNGRKSGKTKKRTGAS